MACTPASKCQAVGHDDTSRNVSKALAEGWDGTAWTIEPAPTPGGSGTLSDVACTAASNCWAVGTGALTLAEHWDGTGWTAVTTPNPAGSPSDGLLGVACTSASWCAAVGDYQKSGSHLTLGEGWNGVKWTLQTTPGTAVTEQDSLTRDTCTSASNCWGVGSHSTGSSTKALVEGWDGEQLDIVADVDPRWQVVTCPVSPARACRTARPSAGTPTAPTLDRPSPSTGTASIGPSCRPRTPERRRFRTAEPLLGPDVRA